MKLWEGLYAPTSLGFGKLSGRKAPPSALWRTASPPLPTQADFRRFTAVDTRSAAVPVVCAVIEDGAGRVLVAQRPTHKHLALKWEFPGGKVERHESPENAIVREIGEELGCKITVERGLPRFAHDYGAVTIEMIPFVCQLAPGSPTPHPHEHVAVQWVRPEALATLDLAAADLPVVADYTRT